MSDYADEIAAREMPYKRTKYVYHRGDYFIPENVNRPIFHREDLARIIREAVAEAVKAEREATIAVLQTIADEAHENMEGAEIEDFCRAEGAIMAVSKVIQSMRARGTP